MIEFIGYNARVTFDDGIVRVIRQEADEEILSACEKLATRQRILGLEVQKAKMTQIYSHLGIIVDPEEATFKVKSASDPRPNLVLVEKSGWEKALKVIAEIQASFDAGNELFFLSLDPSLLPARKLEKHAASDEWTELALETKKALCDTPDEGWIHFSIQAPEYPDGLGFQCAFNGPKEIHLELFDSEEPPFGQEVKIALKKAGWADPTEDIPLFTIDVEWSDEQSQNVANFMMNTLQWCLFLDAATVSIESAITEDS
jgi:hypothetical protein